MAQLGHQAFQIYFLAGRFQVMDVLLCDLPMARLEQTPQPAGNGLGFAQSVQHNGLPHLPEIKIKNHHEPETTKR
jgi:hypothetical protein